jgi:hypothetical protein
MKREALFQVKLRQQSSKPWISRKKALQLSILCLVACIISIYRFAHASVSKRRKEAEESPQQHRIQYADHLPASWECMQPGSCQNLHRYGATNFSYSPSRGFFPAGCKWRDVTFENGTRQYEYWLQDSGSWVPEQPIACTLQVRDADHAWRLSGTTSALPVHLSLCCEYNFTQTFLFLPICRRCWPSRGGLVGSAQEENPCQF